MMQSQANKQQNHQLSGTFHVNILRYADFSIIFINIFVLIIHKYFKSVIRFDGF